MSVGGKDKKSETTSVVSSRSELECRKEQREKDARLHQDQATKQVEKLVKALEAVMGEGVQLGVEPNVSSFIDKPIEKKKLN